MDDISKSIIQYYSDCIKEEARYSVLRNIKGNKDITVVNIGKNNKIFSQYPAPVPCPEKTAELTEVMIKEKNNPELQLIYVYKFAQYRDEKGKEIVTPLIYTPCTVSREQGTICVKIDTDKPILNGNLFLNSTRVNKCEGIDLASLIESYLTLVPSIPISEDGTELNALEVVLKSTVPELKDCIFTKDSAVILCKMTKSYARIFNDYLRILKDDNLANSALSCLYSVTSNDVGFNSGLVKANYNDLSPSQDVAVNEALSSKILAIIGAPGTGKSTTIVGLATSYIANGKSVLIASKMNEALDVIEDRLRGIQTCNKLPQYFVRTGNKVYRRELSKFLEKILISSEHSCNDLFSIKDVKRLTDEHDLLVQRSIELDKLNNELSKKSNFTLRQCFKRLKKTLRRNILKKEHRQFEIDEASVRLSVARGQAFCYAVHEKHNNTVSGTGSRQVLINMSKTLERYGYIGEEEFAYATKYMLPCWLSTVNDVADTIPCVRGLFDIVIIDESSQCDIASALPLLYRAKQAVIVGDNNQIKFLSFMENVKTDFFMSQRDIPSHLQSVIDYKRNSLFDFGMYYSSKKPVMLKEFFRGPYDLIEFSNKKFYNGNLIKMRDTDDDVIQVNFVSDGKCDRKKTCNYVEARRVVDRVRSLTHTSEPVTIGILSPFKAQVDLIRDMLKYNIDEAVIERHKIIVGTAHAFQGNERDIMLLSFAVDKNSHVQSHTFINNPNLFNVAITRAKKKLEVFISYNYNEVNLIPSGLLKEYLQDYLE